MTDSKNDIAKSLLYHLGILPLSEPRTVRLLDEVCQKTSLLNTFLTTMVKDAPPVAHEIGPGFQDFVALTLKFY